MWESLKLGDICDLQNGFAFKSKDYVESSNTLNIRMSNIRPNGNFDPLHNVKYLPDNYSDTYANYKLFDGDLIIAMTDMAGDPKILGKPTLVEGVGERTFLLNQRVGKLHSFSERVFVPFLSYFLSSLKDYYKSLGAGGLQINISKKDILSAEIKLPPLEEQQRIVAKLDATFAEIDEAIALSKKQAISARDYGYRVIKTTLEELSEKHGSSSLSNTAVIQPKKKLALAKLNEDDDVSFMGMDGLGIEEKYSQPETIKKLSEVYKSYQYFKDNDVIFAKITPCFENGKLSIVKGLTNGVGFGSSEFVVLRTHANFQPEFLYYCLLDEVFRNNGAENMSGAVGHKRVTKEYFSNYTVPTPQLDVQQLTSIKFDEVWKNTRSIVSAKHKKIEELTNLKSAILLQKLQSEAA